MERTLYNGVLRKADVGRTVTLIGWVARRRNLGALVFIDLRDHTGMVQLTFNEALAEQIKDVRNEYILQVTGRVALKEVPNPHLATGEVEVQVSRVKVINKALNPPIIISDDADTLEDTRLKYRYLDLRRPHLQEILRMRSAVTLITRNYLTQQGFCEVDTPILSNPTPEGARDYLVPSRLNKGCFYALPQSPQLYKQLLMVGGFEKYFQIARCFRDEDLRSDRQPEFTQIDIEMSFIDEEDIWKVVEDLMREIFRKVKNTAIGDHFIRIKYDECLSRFGSDKPDLRFGLECACVNELFRGTAFSVFRKALDSDGYINALKVPGQAAAYSRKKIDELAEIGKGFGASGLAFLKYESGAFSGSLAKALDPAELDSLKQALQIGNNDLILFVADDKKVAQTALGAIRVRLGHDLKLIQPGYRFLWVTDFPMFEYSKDEGRWVAAHHPFTSPNAEDVDKLLTDPAHCYSRAYDLVLNGYELLSGSIRIHERELQEKVFEAIGLSLEEAHDRFGYFMDAFQYGTPPHGGVGIGLERLTMLLAGTDNIRDVVAFPKTNSASELMSSSPSPVAERQLKDLHIKIAE